MRLSLSFPAHARLILAAALALGVGLAAAPSQSQSPPAAAAAAPDPAAPASDPSAEPAHRSRTTHHPAPLALAAPAAPAPLAPSERLSPGQPAPPAELAAFVDGVVTQAMAQDHIAGVQVSIVQNGQVVMKRGYGFAGPGRPVDPDATLFRLASISKTFTWIALMKEVEAGHMRLDLPVNLYLPEELQVRDQHYKRPVAVRDLMTHSAGFEDRVLGQLFEEDPARIRPLFKYLSQEHPRRVREAGAMPTYSNYGAALAGEAVSYVNGHPYQDIVEGEIIRPLGLAHTTFREPYPARPDLPAPMAAALAGAVSTGYHWHDGTFEPERFEYVTHAAPAAALSSTAGDMARYMLAILGDGKADGVTLYGPDTARGFRTTLQTIAPGVNGWDNGFMEFALPGGYRGQGHWGDTLWFHSRLVTIPQLNLGIFVTTNTDTGPRLVDDLPERVVEHFYAQPQTSPRAGSAALAEDASAYEGTYLTTRRPYGGLGQLAFMLIGHMQVRVTPDGRLLTEGAGETRAWTPTGQPGQFIAVDGPQISAFQMEDGRARRWFAPSGSVAFERVGPLFQTPTLITLAVLAVLASIATLAGQFLRDPREFRQTATQGRANLVQATIAVLWLIVSISFGLWAMGARDLAKVMYHWPGPLLLIASACAFVAAILTLLTLGMLPWVWRGGRRLDSWNGGRKLRFTFTTLVFTAFSVVLGLWGALEPWSR